MLLMVTASAEPTDCSQGGTLTTREIVIADKAYVLHECAGANCICSPDYFTCWDYLYLEANGEAGLQRGGDAMLLGFDWCVQSEHPDTLVFVF